jgi:molybdate transport system ATP-binding protein
MTEPAASPPALEADIVARRGERLLGVAFTLRDGITALAGPSGAGKTTMLDVIAGLLAPVRARVMASGEVLTDTQAGVAVPAHRRGIGYVFQDARLFPHISVAANLHYAARARRLAPDAAEEARIVTMLGIGALLRRRPNSLSGGERQRVAIGRALLSRPRLLLLDEPLASIDASRKSEILYHIERVRDELRMPILYVTHAEGEVERLANAVVHVRSEEVVL